MDEIEVHVVEAQALRRGVESTPDALLASPLLDPQLGGHEQLIVRDAARGDGAPDCLFVAV